MRYPRWTFVSACASMWSKCSVLRLSQFPDMKRVLKKSTLVSTEYW